MEGAKHDRAKFIRTLAEEAGALASAHFRKRDRLKAEQKGPQDFVSAADREVEALIRARVRETYPKEAFLGEESGGESGNALWIVDPIDGTTNFLRGIPQWCVSIAFARAGTVELAALAAPEQGELYLATRGGGATLNGAPIGVAKTAALDHALVGLGYSPKTPPAAYVRFVERLLEAGALYRLVGSGALNLLNVATGRVDAFYEGHLSAWDAQAALLVIREAGGVTIPDEAAARFWPGGPVFACTPGLLEALTPLLPEAEGRTPRSG